MAKYLSNRQKNLKVGIVSYTESNTVLEVTGKVGIGTTNASTNLDVIGNSRITGILTINQIDVNGLSPDGTNYGTNSYVPVANGGGGWSWQPVTSAGAGTLSGISIRDEGSVIGTSGSITELDFRGNNIIASSTVGGSIATITVSDNPSFTNLTASGISTFGSVKISSGIVTASSGVVTYYGDGRYLTNITSGVGLGTSGGIVGYGATIIYFQGAGISTVTVSDGIGTINLIGGGGASIAVTSVAPSSPSLGNLWFNIDQGRTFIYYDEIQLGVGTDKYWIDAAPFNVGIVTVSYADSADYSRLSGISTNVRGSANRVLYNSSTDTTTTSQNLTFDGTTLAVNSTPGSNTSSLFLSGTPFGNNSKNGLLGIGTLGFTDSNLIANFATNVNSYAQVILQNLSTGNAASSDFIVNSDSPLGQSYYGDFGINGTNYTGGGPFGDTSGTYLYAAGGTLAVGTNDAQDFRIATGSSSATPVTRVTVLGTSGNVGIASTQPTSTLTVQGNALITGVTTATDFNSTSDEKLKTNIQPISTPLDKITQLNGVEFTWKETNKPSIGVIAQEVEKILPQLVSQGETKTVNYNGIIGVLIEAIKELKEEIEELKKTK